jgi:ABC-type Mn2+/Zn2+ transport system ATPase subunit
MEYNDTKAIVSLEQRLGKKSELNRAYIFQQEINALNFLSDLYNLSNGSTSSVELTNTLVLMKKADLNALIKGYKTLDEASRTRLNEMWDKYRKEESSIIVTEKNREEISALRNEIERLKKELQQSNLKKGRQ